MSVLATFTTTTAHAGDVATIGTLSYTELRSPDGTGELVPYADGAGLSITFLEPDNEISLGGEVQAMFLAGDVDRRLYDLGLSFLVSYGLKGEAIVPYMRIGLDLAAVSAPDIDESRRRSIMGGVHGGAGLHGFMGKKLYWRAELGFLGAGPGGVTGRVGLGYTFGNM